MFGRRGFDVTPVEQSKSDKKLDKLQREQEKKAEKQRETERKEAERIRELERKENEKKEAERKERERKEIERKEAERREAEKIEAARRESERRGSSGKKNDKYKDEKRKSDNTKLSTCERFLMQAKVDFMSMWENKNNRGPQAKLEDFERVRTIGTGSFGRVIVFQHKVTKKYLVTKVMEKARIVKMKQVEHTLNEKRILQCIKHPFVVHLEYSFKDNDNLYLVLPFISGGDLFSMLRRSRKFPEEVTRFYGAQVTLALEYLHHMGLVYRDLKPENIVIDALGNIRITDFGFCKMVNKGRTWTLCGTPDYIAPELILTKGHGLAADWWSLGVLLFEMAAGYTPFYSSNQMQIYENIVSCKVKYPLNFSAELKYLIGNLLQPDLSRRYGNLKNGVNDIKKHRWFRNIDWDAMLQGRITPPIKPRSKGPGDTSNFDNYEELPIKSTSAPKYAKEFEDF